MKKNIFLLALILTVAHISLAQDSSVVSLVQSTAAAKATDLTYPEILKMTREAIELAGGLNGIVKQGDVVVLKPNIVTSIWNWGASGGSVSEFVNGVCTDRRVVQAVAEIVREIVGPYNPVTGRGKIMVIEGATSSTERNYKNLGYTIKNLVHVDEIIALENEGKWVKAGDASGSMEFVTQVELKNFVYKNAAGQYGAYYNNDGKYWINKKMYEADVLICLPVVKNHWHAVVSGSIKNIGIGAAPPSIYGISRNNLGRNNMVNHNSPSLHDWIADYFACLPADFVVMDGLQGLQNGPFPGVSSNRALAAHQKNMRTILASKDPLAIDVVQANIMGWDYATVRYFTTLASRGTVGPKPNGRVIKLNGNPKDIVVVGNKKVDDIRGDFAGNMDAGTNGNKIPAEKQVKPTVTINSAAFSGNNLNIALTLSAGANDNVVKVDIYIDDIYQSSFNTNLRNISLNTAALPRGEHKIEVRAFTNYMYSASANVIAAK